MGKHPVASRRAVFLDRDGVLNRVVVRDGKPYPPASAAELEIYPDVPKACAILKEAGFLLIVVTNQPDVGRGTQTREAVEAMHARLEAELPLDHIEVCYDDGNTPSEFRKPAPGMVLKTARMFSVELPGSFLVGDRWRDVDCGIAAGCRTIFIDRGYREALRGQPDFRAGSLIEAAEIIVEHSDRSETTK